MSNTFWQTLQSAVLVPLYGKGHVEQVASVQFPRQLHEQLPSSPVTDTEWSLQSVLLHILVQFGYPPYPEIQAPQFMEALTRGWH